MSTHDDDDDRDYEVGYRRPPKATQYKNGHSGNPKGRPKGAKGFSACIKREFSAHITVREGDKAIQMSKSEALVKRLFEMALRGDIRALKMLAEHDADLSREIEARAAVETSAQRLDEDDQAILSHFADLARKGAWNPDVGKDKP